ncbi:unnamed protein product [Aphanomyces euteiches]
MPQTLWTSFKAGSLLSMRRSHLLPAKVQHSVDERRSAACLRRLFDLPGPANIRSTASLLLLDDDNSSFLSQHSKVSSDVEQVPVQEPVLSYSQFDLKLTSDDDGNIFNSSRQLFV